MILHNAIYPAWFIALTLVGTVERAHQHRVVTASEAVAVGMTQADVLKILGPPDGIDEAKGFLSLFFMKGQPKQWMYGTSVDVHSIVVPGVPFLNPLPMNLRIFSYAEEDVVIGWSHDDVVVEVRRPTEFEVPQQADEMLDVVYFVNDVFELARQAEQ